jgi:hypothetical protein
MKSGFKFKEKNMNKTEVISLQQETGLKYYEDYKKEMNEISAPAWAFWEWYGMWCMEEGLFNDRASYQHD